MFRGKAWRGVPENLVPWIDISVQLTALDIRMRNERLGYRRPGFGLWEHGL